MRWELVHRRESQKRGVAAEVEISKLLIMRLFTFDGLVELKFLV